MSGFLFERDFDQEIEAERHAGLHPEAQDDHGQSQREATAFADGHAQGYSEGVAAGRAAALAQAEADIAQRETEALQALLPEIAALSADAARHRHQRDVDLAQMCLALARQALPEVLERFGQRRLEAFCRRALALAEGPEGVEIRLAPAVFTALSAKLSLAATPAGAALRLTQDASLAPHEARATWAGGGADYAADLLGHDILSTLDILAQAPMPGSSGTEP